MFVLFEEDGAFRAGTVLTDNDATLQVENTHGKRVKLKRAQVLLEFRAPEPDGLLATAQASADDIDVEFLWEVCGDDEFGFAELAAEYHGQAPSAVEAAAILLRLHSAPVWFHRKGKGRFRKAPEDILRAALAGLEKKRLQAEAIERMRAELVAGRLPAELAALMPQALYRPDRNRIEIKALEAACVDSGLSAARLLLKCGARFSCTAGWRWSISIWTISRPTTTPSATPQATACCDRWPAACSRWCAAPTPLHAWVATSSH